MRITIDIADFIFAWRQTELKAPKIETDVEGSIATMRMTIHEAPYKMWDKLVELSKEAEAENKVKSL